MLLLHTNKEHDEILSKYSQVLKAITSNIKLKKIQLENQISIIQEADKTFGIDHTLAKQNSSLHLDLDDDNPILLRIRSRHNLKRNAIIASPKAKKILGDILLEDDKILDTLVLNKTILNKSR